jgi:tRNA(Arg) A34 adenosine deaminase TadA
MCCGAILTSGIDTLVMGARHDPAQSRWGGYTVERLLELTNSASQLTVVTGILTRACADVRSLESS